MPPPIPWHAPCDAQAAGGYYNCDRTGGCEREGGCDGDHCLPETACDPDVPFSCGDAEHWCYAGHPSGTPQCRACTAGSDDVADYLNCDGLAGCEHDCPGGRGPCSCP